MKSKSFKLFGMIMIVLFSLFICGGAFAADEDGQEENQQTEQAEETSAFQNQVQAQRAIRMANAYAEEPDPELEQALNDVEEARQNLADAEEGDDIGALEDALAAAQEKADGLMAENADVTAEEIGEMRADGMGWGEIAHELGLHPSVLGMGQAKAYRERERERSAKGYGPGGKISDDEINEATARNFKSGLSKGHGASADKGNNSGGKGGGVSKGKENNGKGKSSGSNKGGNGNGKGGGKNK